MEILARRGHLRFLLALGCGACGSRAAAPARPVPAEVLLAPPRGGGVESLTVAWPPEDRAAPPRPTASGKVITFIAGDPRDLLDGGVDALLSDDPALIDYAATRPRELAALALPWNRTYGVLAVVGLPVTDTAGFRDRMADAVSGAARGAGVPAWWREAARCPGTQEPPSASRAIISDRIVYLAGDRHAQEVAERLVALAARLRAVGLDQAGFDQALAAGDDFAYVLATPSRVGGGAACRELRQLRLAPGHLARLLPLVETRWHLIVRRGRFGVSVDTEGTPHFR